MDVGLAYVKDERVISGEYIREGCGQTGFVGSVYVDLYDFVVP